jgi:two-component system sensor histidine kinase BaeS
VVLLEAEVVGDEVMITVADQGEGIGAEELPSIFDRFHQAGDVMSREQEGAGLGLYITKRLVDAMGGSIEVTSEPGHGSTFVVRIPSEVTSEGDGEAPSSLSAESTPATP